MMTDRGLLSVIFVLFFLTKREYLLYCYPQLNTLSRAVEGTAL
jgi:hypothetical protein